MMPAPIAVPDLVRQCALSNGIEGRRWLAELPEVVATMTERWNLELGPAFPGGTASFVAGATDQSGRACVLKVAMPFQHEAPESFGRTVLVHQLAAGRGCVALLHSDEPTRAMLLERLGPNLDELGMPLPLLLETVAVTLRDFWRPVSDASDLPTGADKAGWLADHITLMWDELGRPCPPPVVERALEYCQARAAAFDPALAVLVHGDAHGWNTLAVGDGTFKLVDPEGLRSERAHDLAVPTREYNRPLLVGQTCRLARQRSELLARLCSVDPEAVWQWGFIERVATGLANVRDFDGDEGMAFLEVAGRCL
jgi:streptomycin 6-kinase